MLIAGAFGLIDAIHLMARRDTIMFRELGKRKG